MEEKKTPDKDFNDTFIKNMPNTIKFSAPSEEINKTLKLQDEHTKEESKKALEFEMMSANPNIESDKLVTEWAEKIYRASNDAYVKLVALCSFENREKLEEFKDIMCGKYLGRFVSLIKSQYFLYFKICGHELNMDYIPGREHIQQIKKILMNCEDDFTSVARPILAQINEALAIAQTVRRNVLYPEFEKMEEEIVQLKNDICFKKNKIDYLEGVEKILEKVNVELQEKLKEKNQQLQTALGMWTHLSYEINNSLMRGTDLFHILNAKLGK